MTDSLHIIVIGAGLMGLCTADELRARGANVTVIDARPGPCEGTSFSNSGMLHPSQAKSWAPDLRDAAGALDAARVSAELGARSTDILLQKMRGFGLPDRQRGCVQIQPDMETARALQNENAALGIPTDIWIDPVGTFGKVACRFPQDASGDARAFGCALEADLAARGVVFAYGAKHISLRKTDAGFSVRWNATRTDFDQLVIAAGTGSVGLLEQLGLRLTLDRVSGAAADFNLPADGVALPDCPVMDAASRTALTIFEDRVRLSGGWNVDDPDYVIAMWQRVAPKLMATLGPPRSSWTSARPVSRVGRPYISETSVPGLWLNTGHGHMGWTLCAGSGELLAQMILEGVQDSRFAFGG